MILAVDIGNTYIVVGCIRGDEIVFVERLHTDTEEIGAGVCHQH